ncbi:MAG: 4'-phosphopantetheinyl transferase superfamily protein [Clostridia bacterium]|nr:4'-phosphopantetheinyl transferase superfamily protein [Clostridia bacterium]
MIKLYRYDILEMPNDEYACLALTLPEDLLKRIDRMAHMGDRKRTLAGHLLILGAAKELCGVSDPTILRTPAGKPYFADLPIKFSLSHSEEKVILAVSDREIGADIERMRPCSLGVAKRFFTAKEQVYVFGKAPGEADFALPKAEQDSALLNRFYEVWTKKEAYGKFVGSGLAATFSADSTERSFYTENDGEYALAVYEE